MKRPFFLIFAAMLCLQGCGGDNAPMIRFTEYYSPQCESCTEMEPVINEVLSGFSGKLIVDRVNLDTPEGTSRGKALAIKNIPVIVLTDREGREYFRHEGKIDGALLKKLIKDKI